MLAFMMRLFRTGIASLSFILRNLWCGKGVRAFPDATFGRFIIGPLRPADVSGVGALYAALNGGRRLGYDKAIVLRLLGRKLALVAREADGGKPVAVTIFYFNARDRRDRTVHAAYNGLLQSAQGAGLGTFMLRHAMKSFARSDLAGVSSRVSVTNRAALKSNERAGFVPVETYFDPFIGEQRHYLLCDLRAHSRLMQGWHS